jgi:hypothetical protein
MSTPIRDYWRGVAKGEFQRVPADSDPELVRLKARFAEAPERSSKKARLGELLTARRNELLASDIRARKARARIAARARTDASSEGLMAVAAAVLVDTDLAVEQLNATQKRVALECRTVRETLAFGAP